jgi:hypothetical protein
MSDGYDNDREKYKPHERGRIFENGTYLYFRDRENGYVQQSRIFKTIEGGIRFDKIKEDQGQTLSIEDKSGRIDGDKDLNQLRVLRALLEKNENHRHLLRSVEGEYRSQEAQKLIDGLKRDFKDRFTHLEISREVVREIWAQGLQREAGQQIELPGVLDRAREGKAQALQNRREKIAELARVRERAEKFRNMLRFRAGATRGRAEAPQRVEHDRQVQEEAKRSRQAHQTPETQRARVEREAADRVAQQFTVPNQSRKRDSADAGGQAARDAADAARAERSAADARTAEEKARKAREAAEKERAEELARLQARGVPPEVVKILGLGQAQPPSAAVREIPGHAPGVVRGGTGQGQERSRGISRDP